ncbi:MAG: tyrosine-type recombinase/integrase [Anaerolineaceae bacterium]|nr:tyrosine-type recombinase/integrase [Anaerolineaceae bacterium]
MRQTAFVSQLTLNLSDHDVHLETWVEGFIVDRTARGLSRKTIQFYSERLRLFMSYCDAQVITKISQLTPTILREYLLYLEHMKHNPGGVHANYRAVRAFLKWWEEELEPEGWKNPINKVKPPRVAQQPLEPVEIDTIAKMMDACNSSTFNGLRDKAVFLALLDTGARANEFLLIDLKDLDLVTGSILIRMGKGRKPRMVYLGKKTRKAIRAYMRTRQDRNLALWVSDEGDRLTYGGLRGIMRRRAGQAGLDHEPSIHSFRRAFALNFLRNNPGDIYSLQRLMGHADLTVLRRYLAQTEGDIHEAYQRGSPVDHADW